MVTARRSRNVDLALGEEDVLDSVIVWLRLMLQQDSCRLDCQVGLNQLATVSKSWHRAVNKQLYRNPFFGNAERGLKLRACLQLQPKNALLITKLILGEGSDFDIKDWKDPAFVGDLVGTCTNLHILGLGGLGHSDVSHVFEALARTKGLHELRACDRLPAPLDHIENFYDQVLMGMNDLRRLRLYGMISMDEDSGAVKLESLKNSSQYKPAQIALKEAAFNYCAMTLSSLIPFLAGSVHTLTKLCLEGPYDITHEDLVVLLNEVASNLRILEVEDFPYGGNSRALSDRASSSDGSESTLDGNASSRGVGTIDAILRACPKLWRLDFIEGVASEKIFDGYDLTNLQEWRFTCAASVRPSHWLDALHRQYFRRGSRARIESLGWKRSEIRHIRIAAWQTGVSWLSDGEHALDFDFD